MSVIPVNLSQVTPGHSSKDVPPGEYLFKVHSIDRKTSDAGNLRLIYFSEILMGPGASTQYNGTRVINSYTLPPGAAYYKTFLIACGFDEQTINQYDGRWDDEWPIGRQFAGIVSKNDQGYPNISGEKPAANFGKTAGGASMAPVAPTVSGPAPGLGGPSLLQAQTPPAYQAQVQAPVYQAPPVYQAQAPVYQAPQVQAQAPQVSIVPPVAAPPPVGIPAPTTGFQAPAPPPPVMKPVA